MHRVIMNAPAGLVVDHIDHDGLNNTRNNLRLCTPRQNRYNLPPLPNGTSKYKGVHWSKSRRKWRVGIKCGPNAYHIGFFKSEIQAAKAYDKAAKEFFGEYAYLNFPELVTEDT
jgi:hypothetical protein